MNNFVNEILETIDCVQESCAESELRTATELLDMCLKYGTICEQFSEDDFDQDAFFYQEGAIGDEMKKMSKDDSSKVWTILAAIPRFIIALAKTISNKLTSKEETDEAFSDENQENIHKIVDEILDGDQKQIPGYVKKLNVTLAAIGATAAVAIVGTGTYLHIKAKNERENGITSIKFPGFMIGKDGKYYMPADFNLDEIVADAKNVEELTLKLKNNLFIKKQSDESGDVEKFEKKVEELADEIFNNVDKLEKYKEKIGKRRSFTDTNFTRINSNTLKDITVKGTDYCKKCLKTVQDFGNDIDQLPKDNLPFPLSKFASNVLNKVGFVIKKIAQFLTSIISIVGFITKIVATLGGWATKALTTPTGKIVHDKAKELGEKALEKGGEFIEKRKSAKAAKDAKDDEDGDSVTTESFQYDIEGEFYEEAFTETKSRSEVGPQQVNSADDVNEYINKYITSVDKMAFKDGKLVVSGKARSKKHNSDDKMKLVLEGPGVKEYFSKYLKNKIKNKPTSFDKATYSGEDLKNLSINGKKIEAYEEGFVVEYTDEDGCVQEAYIMEAADDNSKSIALTIANGKVHRVDATKLADAVKGNFIKCIDGGKGKLVKIVAGKEHIGKSGKVLLTFSNNNNEVTIVPAGTGITEAEWKKMSDEVLNNIFGDIMEKTKDVGKNGTKKTKKETVRTPFGNISRTVPVKEYAEDTEASFDDYVVEAAFIETEDDVDDTQVNSWYTR